jgi:integrase
MGTWSLQDPYFSLLATTLCPVGTVRERQPGVWEVRVYVGRDPVTNAPRQVSKIIHAGPRTKKGNPPKAVTDLEHQLEAEAAEGKLGGTSATVGLLLDRYLEHLTRQGHSPKTLDTYRRYVNSTIRPALGAVPVRKLTAWDLDALSAKMAAAGKKASTIRQHHAILSGALSQAVKWGWVPTNVARSASPPRVRAAKVEPPTPEQVRRLIAVAEERNPILAALIMLAALTGARRGELCALRWSDVELDTGRLRIARSIIVVPDEAPIEKDTKSHAERTLALGDAGTTLLRLHREQALERARIGEIEIAPDAFVFSTRVDCTTPIRPDVVSAFFGRARDQLGLRHVHLHSLRHFAATQLAARGDVSARTIAGRLGHADASLTMRVYAAFFPAADVEAADHLGLALKG